MRTRLSITGLTTLIASAALLADTSTHAGVGTHYDYQGGGHCSFTTPRHVMTAAMNATDYQGSAACGGLVVVTNTDNDLSVVVRIDDECPECAPGDIDLDRRAFVAIAQSVTGRIPIRWHYLPNDQDGTLKLHFKEGSSQWWTAVQVRNHRYPIAQLAYRSAGRGAYQPLPREPYNYFIAHSGMGHGPYDFRLTDFTGHTVELHGVTLQPGADVSPKQTVESDSAP
ncbi:MAG: expansin EXLX1 family cellulose-binding protein [Spongiibacter sp.]